MTKTKSASYLTARLKLCAAHLLGDYPVNEINVAVSVFL